MGEGWRGWLRTHGDPPARMLPARRHAVVTSDTYDDRAITIPVWLVAVSDTMGLVVQAIGPEREWLAWVPRSRIQLER